MKASVIIPVYNGSTWVRDINSSLIYNQEVIGEVLLINDGNAIDFEIFLSGLSSYKTFPTHIFNTTGKCGPGFARNLGLKNAKFPLVAFLDCDDIWLAGSLKKRIDCLIENADSCAFVSSSFYKFKKSIDEHKTRVISPSKATASMLLVTNHVFLSSVVVKRELLSGTFFENVGHEDLVFWLDILTISGKCMVSLDEPLCLMRTSPNSVSSNKVRSAFWYWRILSRFEVPFFLRCYVFLIYAANAVAKRYIKEYKPFYFLADKAIKVFLPAFSKA